MKIEDTVSFILANAGTAHRNLIEDQIRPLGLHSRQLFVLFELWKQDGLRQIDLAARLGVSAATVNKALGGLLESDFVTRVKYENDARSTRICLTRKGRDVRPKVEAVWHQIDRQTTGGLTDVEETMLRQLLPKLVVEII
ncbi:MAG TPA: MarR family transcriptional regulator [Pyrinomonadaceae bacterium]|nr:MarR family transcriptional regulator [Pyrinomonadaceae bacterium]